MSGVRQSFRQSFRHYVELHITDKGAGAFVGGSLRPRNWSSVNPQAWKPTPRGRVASRFLSAVEESVSALWLGLCRKLYRKLCRTRRARRARQSLRQRSRCICWRIAQATELEFREPAGLEAYATRARRIEIPVGG